MKYEITAKRLKQALNNKNMIPQELAERSQVSKASISQYINGSHAPSNISSGKMAPVLDVNPLWLMGFDVPMTPTVPSDKTASAQEDSNDLPYYINDDAREMAQFMFENPEYKVLFDASRKISKEDIETVKAIMDRFKRPDND